MNSITTDEVKTLQTINDKLLLVNTLDAPDFSETKIPGSVNVPQSDDDFVSRMEELAQNKKRPIVVYCANGDCESSTKAAQKLDDAGFSVVLDYEGGAKAWTEAGETLAA